MKTLTKLSLWVLQKALESKNQNAKKIAINWITQTYKTIATNRLDLKTEIVKVKKGNKRFYLAFFENKKGVIKCDIGGHLKDTLPASFVLTKF